MKDKKDILFVLPLYYSANGIRRLALYLSEEKGVYDWDVYTSCSNPKIARDAYRIAEKENFIFESRPNDGAGAGALWWLQNSSGVELERYRYIWYFEESCEPVRPGWVSRLIAEMEQGAPLTGWWWWPDGRRRPYAIRHEVRDSNNRFMVCYENTDATGRDDDGHPFWKMYDTPGYRGETFVVRAEDFLAFDYPDASDPFWEQRNGIRTYGVKAERFWWDVEDQAYHGIPLPCPNIQWYVLQKHHFVPPRANRHRSYFRELPMRLRTDSRYRPRPVYVRWGYSIVRGTVQKLDEVIRRIYERGRRMRNNPIGL